MNMLKRSLAMLLVLCMMLSMVPFTAFAEESADPTGGSEPVAADVPEGEIDPDEGEQTTDLSEENTADGSDGNESAGNGSAGGESADGGSAGNGAADGESADGESAGNGSAGDESDANDPTDDEAADGATNEDSIEESTDATEDPYGIDTTSLEDEIMVTALTMGTKPPDGTTSGEPFPENTGGSYSFRIPAMVTLSDGTLVAAADARWNTTYDGGGLDTIVARSSDKGATWNYTFANYLGDNGNVYNGSSTCFIDPSLAVTASDTIYMLCDLYPYGVALNGNKETTPSKTKGFDANGRLLLSNDSHGSYGYYLDGGKIYSTDGTEQTGYSVDAYFNITGNGYDTNLFFSDSPFKVVRTGFLYLTKSTNQGATWSAPTLLNLKTASEMVCLVGPNGGMVTSKGVIVFPVYSYDGSAEYLSLVYSNDNGATWSRSTSLTSIDSSEADVVELGNGKLRAFFRNHTTNLCYADYDLTSNSWSGFTNTRVYANSNTELSAITYSKGVVHNGVEKNVILVSCPASANKAGSSSSDGSWRTSGTIFAGLVDPDDYTMTWLDNNVDVTPIASGQLSGNYTAANGFFAYSSIAELNDGSVAILYEDNQYGWGAGTGYGYTMAFKTYSESDLETAFAVTFDEGTNGDGSEGGSAGSTTTETVEVNLKVGETAEYTISGIAETGKNTDTSIATVTWTGTTAGGTTEKLTAVTLPTSTGSVQAYITDGNGNYLSNNGTTITNATSAADATKWTIIYEDTPNWDTNTNNMSRYNVATTINGTTYYIDGNLSLTSSDSNNNFWHTAENGFFGGFAGTNGWNFDGTAWTINSSGYGNANAYTVETVTGEAADSTTVTITGNAVGNTKVTVGTTAYNITVIAANVTNTVNVELMVGEKITYEEDSGAYSTAAVEPDADIVKMELSAVNGVTETTVSSTKATTLEDGATYVIRVFDTIYALSTDSGSNAWGTGTLAFQTNQLTADEKHLWTLERVDGGYKLKSDDGYLNLGTGNNSAYLNSTGEVFTITSTSTGWTIGNQSGRYINALGGLTSYYSAGGWTGDGTRFDLYKVTAVTPASTEVAFTGLKAGETVAVVGNTQYNITVKAAVVNVNLEVGESLTYTDTTGNYVGSDTIVNPNTDIAIMTVTAGKALKEVTALESGKQYLIVNKANGTVLTDTEMTVTGDYGNKPGLATTGTASATSKELWTVTASGNDFTVAQNGQYLTVAGFEAGMSETETPLTLTYTADGWTIYDYTTGPALGHNGAGYYLSDNVGNNYINGALGTADTTNAYRYWTIYEIVDANTDVTFTGKEIGNTTATVGSTTYNITVEEYILDDEINSTNDGYTVNAELQRSRYNELTNNVVEDLYTDESWTQYEAARKAAYSLLNSIDGTTYATEAEADAAIAELVAAMDALEQAKSKLVAAQTITVHYTLNGTTVETREYKVAADATTLTLPDVVVVDKQTYTISATQKEDIIITDGVLTLPQNDTVVYVAVDKGAALGNGLVASDDISADGDYVGTGAQIADLVKDDGTAMKITEMTLTTGVSYDLNLADTLADGQTVTWSSSDEKVATVDENGNVTAVGAGTATITATVKDADGNIVSVNSIPVTVFERATTDRLSAVYIEEVTNTTVWCVINADTDAKAFQVIEGELIYGYFDTTVDDGTATTAVSFFGDPDEAHALVAMTSTNSFGDYYLLHDDDGNMGIGTEYYRLPDNTTGAGYWQAIGLTDNVNDKYADWTIIEKMIQWAIDEGCDGGMGFTRRQSEGNIGSNLTFISDPMPTIEKQVDGVLPTSRKQADYRRYTEGMVAAVNELVYFKITVNLDMPTTWTDDAETISAITYTDAIVSDTVLKGAYLYTKELDQADGVYDGEIEEGNRVQTQDITTKLNAAWTDEEKAAGKRVLEFYLMYEIQESDIPKFYIDNIANLSYDYKSAYSTGAQKGAADAEARISVVGTAIDDVVIDFGQSFVYQGHDYTSITDGNSYTFEGLTNVHLKGAYVDGENDIAGITSSKATAKYGDVKVTRTATGKLDDKDYPEYTYTVTYTPTQILQGVDTVLIYGYGDNNQEKIINGFLVYPATTVYYEEGFMLNGASTWDGEHAKKATGYQTFELLGDSQFNDNGELTHKVSNKKHAYGYDPLYENPAYDYGDSYASADTVGEVTTFQFTGTGFDLYANCTEKSGYVAVQVKDTAGNTVKMYTVNTIVEGGVTDATTGQTGDEYHLPIVSEQGLEHGTYTVTVRKIVGDGKTVKLDGVRIFNTVADSSIFNIDLEDNPEFYQLRDYVLSAMNVGDSEQYGRIAEMAEQVYAGVSTDDEAPTAVILANGIYNSDVQDLLDNGPKNETFLYKDQTLVFKVKTSRALQLGLKAPVNATNYDLKYTVGSTETSVATNAELGTSVDMFYELRNSIGTETEYTVTVTNTGSNILSVTDLKICDDPNAQFVPLTSADIETALHAMGYTDDSGEEETPTEPEAPVEPEITYADAVLTVELVDYAGNVIGSADLTANGVEGETNVFTAEEILAAVDLPENYAYAAKTADVAVVYGENRSVSVQVGKVATLKITFISLFGRKLGTATITKVQTAAGHCRISAAEIRALAPAGRRGIWLLPAVVNYGSSVSIAVPVI